MPRKVATRPVGTAGLAASGFCPQLHPGWVVTTSSVFTGLRRSLDCVPLSRVDTSEEAGLVCPGDLFHCPVAQKQTGGSAR